MYHEFFELFGRLIATVTGREVKWLPQAKRREFRRVPRQRCRKEQFSHRFTARAFSDSERLESLVAYACSKAVVKQ